MPSLNRPNAPDRLPSSDFGNLFGRPRAVRGSDLASPNSTPSPFTTPTNNYIAAQRRVLRSSDSTASHPASSSPLASPVPLVARQRPRLVEGRSYHSDINIRSPWEAAKVSSPSTEVPLIIEEEPAPLKNRTASETSSISSRARRLPALPSVRITPGPGSEQPPSKARSGFKWKRQFSGRWLEIRIGRKERSAEQSVQVSGEATPVPRSNCSSINLPLTQAPTITDPSDHDPPSNTASAQRLLPESRDPLQDPHPQKEGLYCRTRRALGLKPSPTSPPPSLPSKTSTSNLLDRVSSTLRFLPPRLSPAPSSATSVSNLSIAAAPRWPRNLLRQQQYGAGGPFSPSTSSSVRSLMMGDTPHTHTPEPEAMYTAADARRYVAVELTDADAGTAFLPSEARRIHTPPLPTDARSPGSGKLRGFFFDYGAPASFSSPSFSAAAPAVGRHADAGTRRDSDWYRVQMRAIEAEALTREQLAGSVPEHLPNSPLCPRHPRHRSGGLGTCPFHGRNPSLPEGDGGESPASPMERWW